MARLVGSAPRGYSEDPELDAKVWESLHISAVFERAGRVRFDPQQFRLPAAHLQPAGQNACANYDPRLLVRADRARVREVQRHRLLRGDQRCRPRRATRLRRHDSPRDRHGAVRARSGRRAGICSIFGRIHPDKGTRGGDSRPPNGRAGRSCSPESSRIEEYFERFVAPLLDGERVRYLGAGRAATEASSFGDALALLHLVNFEEPFGFSVVEAMACGTPVIATRSWVDAARSFATGRTVFWSARVERSGRGGRGRQRLGPGAPCVPRSSGASPSTGWWTTISTSTRVVELHQMKAVKSGHGGARMTASDGASGRPTLS